jgi:chitosanase
VAAAQPRIHVYRMATAGGRCERLFQRGRRLRTAAAQSWIKETPMLTDLQIRGAQTIVVVFETGDPRGDYGAVTVIPGDTGHLTYGRLQTTLGSGNLHALIQRYCTTPGAARGDELSAYLDRLKSRDLALDDDRTLHTLLEEAGEDPVMRDVQNRFFEGLYWTPSNKAASASGITSALGASVVFDGFIQGSWGAMRDRTTQRFGGVAQLGEREWMLRYVEVRREWLATHPRADLRQTVYRMDAYRLLFDQDNWELTLPFSVRGSLIDETLLRTGARQLTRGCKGDDVRALQRALMKAGAILRTDGNFGAKTETALGAFQQQLGLPVTAKVDDPTRTALGLV